MAESEYIRHECPQVWFCTNVVVGLIYTRKQDMCNTVCDCTVSTQPDICQQERRTQRHLPAEKSSVGP